MVGGGRVALRRVRLLRSGGAAVTVVAPDVLPALARLPGVRVRRRGWRPADFGKGRGAARLVVVATNNDAVNRRAAALAMRKKIWVNAAFEARRGNVVVPAVARLGRLTAAVSTGGADPALARLLSRRLQKFISGQTKRP